VFSYFHIRIFNLWLFAWTVQAVLACNSSSSRSCEVNVELQNAYNQTVYLESIAEAGSDDLRLDSVFIKDRVETVHFRITDTEESLYRIRTADGRLRIPFVSDTRSVKICADYFEPGSFKFERSPATSTLHQFNEWLLRQAQDVSNIPETISNIDSVRIAFAFQQQQHYRNFIDTVASPAVALFYYDNVDFGKQLDSLVLLMNRLHKRFAGHKAWERLYEETKVFEQIITKELNVGDRLPDFLVTNEAGALLPITFYRHGYLLVDLWATWDYRSHLQAEYTKRAYTQFGGKNFSVVSIALDPNKEGWQRSIELNGRKWPQMIDQKVWRGPAVQALHFDSIPFNFLVDPNGIIVGKALYGDSLLSALSRTLENVRE